MKNVRRKTTTSFISAPKTLLSASSLPISIRRRNRLRSTRKIHLSPPGSSQLSQPGHSNRTRSSLAPPSPSLVILLNSNNPRTRFILNEFDGCGG
ncbi:hypothetical protein HID58_070158 [Brassica napus]|uniref:Uncharacterized protein n=1 Tax=Brassica napus TaxID=3708 RepID=A0ABQ7YY37_BRANA|nr:hypothetical protein HID58_070158 [Brassica napus]